MPHRPLPFLSTGLLIATRRTTIALMLAAALDPAQATPPPAATQPATPSTATQPAPQPATPSAASDDPFCAGLAKAIQDSPNGFMAVRRASRGERRWASAVALPGLGECVVTEDEDTTARFACAGPLLDDAAKLEASYRALMARTRACLSPDWLADEHADEDGGTEVWFEREKSHTIVSVAETRVTSGGQNLVSVEEADDAD